jgi:hypothetical protein
MSLYIVCDSKAAVREIDTINTLVLFNRASLDLTDLMPGENHNCSLASSVKPFTIAAEQALQKLRNP